MRLKIGSDTNKLNIFSGEFSLVLAAGPVGSENISGALAGNPEVVAGTSVTYQSNGDLHT